jgi:hypothetical protein
VPRVSDFYGITISMYFNDHAPPHFHVIYAEHEASMRLADLTILEGKLPSRASRLVREWAGLHAQELWANWEKARAGLALDTIPGLE